MNCAKAMLQALILKFDVLMQQDDIDRNGEEFHAIKVKYLYLKQINFKEKSWNENIFVYQKALIRTFQFTALEHNFIRWFYAQKTV